MGAGPCSNATDSHCSYRDFTHFLSPFAVCPHDIFQTISMVFTLVFV